MNICVEGGMSAIMCVFFGGYRAKDCMAVLIHVYMC